MPLIDRDLLRAFIQVFTAVLSLLTVAIFVSVLLEYFNYIFGAGESRFGWVVLYFVYTLPSDLLITLPMTASVSVLWVLATKARSNELLACFASGVSPRRLSAPFLWVAFAISVVGLAITEFVAAPAMAQAHRIEKIRIKGRDDTVVSRRDNILQKGRGDRFYAADFYDDREGVMSGVMILDHFPGTAKPKWKLDAESAKITEDHAGESWNFENARVREYDESGNIVKFTTHDTLLGSELETPVDPHLDRMLSKRTDPDRMGILELRQYLALLRDQGTKHTELAMQWHLKLAMPIATMILILLMCSHSIRPSAKGVVVSFGGGLAWMVGFSVAQIALRKLGDAEVLPVMVAAWLPHVLFGAIGFYMLKKVHFA